MLPIYQHVKAVPQRILQRGIVEALERFRIADCLPSWLREKRRLMGGDGGGRERGGEGEGKGEGG